MEVAVLLSQMQQEQRRNFVAKGGSSPHNYGVAIDIALYKRQEKPFLELNSMNMQIRLKTETGVTWGGDWGSYGKSMKHSTLNLLTGKENIKSTEFNSASF